jgi:hypothetical protein
MSEQEHPLSATQPPEKAAGGQHTDVDLDALTAAVERLLRRDLEIARERLFGARRP